MFDAKLRPLIDPPLDRIAGACVRLRLSANAITMAGFLLGLVAAVVIGFGMPLIGLILILINRVMDGLDGAVARRIGRTDFGGYLDIVLDFLIYAAIPLGFAVMNPTQNALAAAFLIFSFVGTGSSFLAYAIVAAKRGVSTDIRGRKSFYYLGGLTEGAETIVFFVVICLLPEHFALLAYGFGGVCWITTVTRIVAANNTFNDTDKS